MKTLVCFLLMFNCFAFKAIVTGEVFPLDSKRALYSFTRFEKNEGDKLFIKGIYSDKEGNKLVTEEAILKDDQTISLSVIQHQTKETSSIVLKDGNFLFAKSGETPQEETFQKNFIVSMTIIPFLQKNWSSILDGKTLSTRFGVWYRQDTVGFDFYKSKLEGENLEITMKPSSFFIRQLVDPLVFIFDKKSKRIKEIIGRTSPKIQRDGKLKDLDAKTIYTYK